MFFKNVLSYSAVNLYAQSVRLLQELGVRFLLPPEVLGLWSLVLVIQNFSLSFDWGVLTASSRELPLLYGGDHYHEAADYRRTTFYLHLLGKLVLAMGVVIYGAYYYLFPFQIQFVAVMAAALMLCCAGIGEAFISFYQSAQQYVLLSKKLFIYWTVYAFIMLVGAYVWAVKGLILGAMLAFCLQAWLLRQSLHFQGDGIFKRRDVSSIVGFALPFRLVDLPMSVAMSLDAIVVARFFDLKILAIYTTAKLIFNQAGQVPTWIGSVFISRMTTLAGNQQNRESLGNEMLLNLTVLNLVLLPVLICFISLTTYWGVTLYLPRYAESLSVLPLLMLSLYFQPRVTVIRNHWIIDKRFGWLAASNLLAMGLMLGGFAWLVFSQQMTLTAIAFTYTFAFAGYFMFVLIRLGRELWGVKKCMLFMTETFAAIALLIVALFRAGLFATAVSTSVGSILQSALSMCLYLLPLLTYGLWRLDAYKHIKTYWLEKSAQAN